MKYLITATVFVVSLFGLLFVSSSAEPVYGQSQTEIVEQLEGNVGDDFGLPRNEPTDSTLQSALQTIFLLAGAVSVIFTAVGGLRYVLSEGNDQKIKQAKDTITYAIVGLIVSMSAYGIVSIILRGIL